MGRLTLARTRTPTPTLTLTRWADDLQLFAAARKRASASYDTDALAYFVQLRVAAVEHAKALQALDARLAKPRADMAASSDAGGVVAAWSEAWRGGATDLAVSVQYASLQQAWGAATNCVRAQARAQAEAARRLGTEVVKPLQVVVRTTAEQCAAALRAADLVLGVAVAARAAAARAAAAYTRELALLRHARSTGGGAVGAEALRASACLCVRRVAEANERTRCWEQEAGPRALEQLQAIEESRWVAVHAALRSFCAIAAEGGALVPTEAAPLLALTTAAASLPADLATFSAAYGTGHDGARVADVLSPPPFSEALAELGPAPSAVAAAAAAANADAVPAAASSLASSVLLPMQAWVTAGVNLLEQSAMETLKEALFAEGCGWGGSRGGAQGRDGGGGGGERLPVAVEETLRGMSLGDMMEEKEEDMVEGVVVEGEGETVVEVAAAEEAAASATKAEVNVTVKAEAEVEAEVEAEAEAEAEEEWHEAAEPEQDWFYQIASGRVVGPVGWAELLCAAREGVLLPSSLTRHGQHAAWLAAESVPTLIVPSLPPPPPPPPPPPN